MPPLPLRPSRRRAPAAALLAGLLAGCGGGPDGAPAASDAAARVRALADEVWEETLARSTYLQVKHGVRVRELADLTPEQAAEDVAFARSLLARLDELPAEELSPGDRLTVEILRWDAERTVESEPYYWLTFPLTPYVVGFEMQFVHQAFAGHPFDDPVQDPAAYLALVDEYADRLRQLTAHLEGQAARGIRLARAALPGVAGLFRSYREAARRNLEVEPRRLETLPPAESERFRDALAEAVSGGVEPAFDALLAIVEGDAYREAAPEGVGLAQYPGGEDYYRYLVRVRTTLDLTPEELHALGRERVEELSAEMAAIREEIGFEGPQEAFHRELRKDPRFLAASPAEVEERYLGYLACIEPRVPELFASTPRAPYGVRRLDPAAEGSMTFGYYQPPTAAQPSGLYRYNGSRLEERSLLFAGPLIYHELVPGHHFHLALQAENEALPLVRREYLGAGAFNEGWGNYAALLAREAGCLEGPWDRYGWAIFDMFISVRLVVDTGLNLLGWSLEEARDYMRRHTFQSPTEIATETLRYSTDLPGQALAYKAGLEKLLELRRRARRLAGPAFDLRDFHDAVLGAGAMPLSILERRVEQRFAGGEG